MEKSVLQKSPQQLPCVGNFSKWDYYRKVKKTIMLKENASYLKMYRFFIATK